MGIIDNWTRHEVQNTKQVIPIAPVTVGVTIDGERRIEDSTHRGFADVRASQWIRCEMLKRMRNH
jgi:hypothetical protein